MSRRIGSGIGAAVNVAIAWAVNVWPGWEAVPFLTDATTDVLPLVNLSLLVGVLVHLTSIFFEPRWFRALGSTLTTGFSLAVLVRTLQVFPFDFGAYASTWELIAEGLLIFGIVTTGLALIVQFVQFVRLLAQGPTTDED